MPLEAANGRIEFATQSVAVTAMEPETDLLAPFSLVITRSGLSGAATILWMVTSSDADFNRMTDIFGSTGQITIPSG